jgi:hypothetical protein
MKPMLLLGVMLAGALGGWLSGGNPQVVEDIPPTPPRNTSSSRPPRVSKVPAEVVERVRQVRLAGNRSERLRQVLILATNLPLEEIPLWYQGNFLEFLDGTIESVFYQILTERWLEAEPLVAARWMLENGKGSSSRALEVWVTKDREAALRFVTELPVSKRGELLPGLILAVGRTSVPEALLLLEHWRMPELQTYRILPAMARQDRAALVSHAQGLRGAARTELIRAAAAAWLVDDLPWVVSLMQREGIGPELFGDLINSGENGAGRIFIEQAGALPDGWLESMQPSDLRLLCLGSEADWLALTGPRPGISAEVLGKIQIQAASTPWWYNDLRAPGLKLVESGDWLPMEARLKIAETLTRRWKDDPEAARRWADSLDGELHTAAIKGLAAMTEELEATQKPNSPDSPDDVIRALQSGNQVRLSELDWSVAQTAQAVRAAKAMTPGTAVDLLPTMGLRHLPKPVAAAVLERALAAPDDHVHGPNSNNQSRDKATYEFAAKWAAEQPAAAAAWVESLPSGEARLWAAKNVALQWEEYSTAEVRAWAAKLPQAERDAVLGVLK